MDEQSIQPVFSRLFLENLLTSLGALPADALMPDFELRLFTAGPSPITPASVAGDFTEADFSGYAAQVVDYAPVAANSPNRDAVGLVGIGIFVRNSVTAPDNTVLGYYVCNSTTHELAFSEYFPAPVTITNLGDYIALEAFLPIILSPVVVDV